MLQLHIYFSIYSERKEREEREDGREGERSEIKRYGKETEGGDRQKGRERGRWRG